MALAVVKMAARSAAMSQHFLVLQKPLLDAMSNSELGNLDEHVDIGTMSKFEHVEPVTDHNI